MNSQQIQKSNEISPPARAAWIDPIWAVVAAFGTYFCMYGFRKPFSVATFDSMTFLGVDYKVLIVITQIMGYTLSKFIGIKVISEMKPHRRVITLLALIGVAEVALLLFAITPRPYNFFWMFFNGLPLGMVFGLVMGFLEGRKQSEALLAGLCCSFILADGVTKSVGATVITWGVSQFWMPAVTGLVFTLPLILFSWMLTRIRPPSDADIAARASRDAMTGADRWRFFNRFAAGLVFIMISFLLVTVLRSLRSDFMPEIWKGMGIATPPKIFAQSETWVGLSVMVISGLSVLIRNNRNALFASIVLSVAGFGVGILALLGNRAGWISPFYFMVLLGFALYVPYVAVHTTIFERLIAATRERGNVAFLMYVVDSFGYLGYVAVILGKSTLKSQANFYDLFLTVSWVIFVGGAVTMIAAGVYFSLHPATRKAESNAVIQPNYAS